LDAELEANKAVSQTFIHATDDEKVFLHHCPPRPLSGILR
jgi:hypothetical protein